MVERTWLDISTKIDTLTFVDKSGCGMTTETAISCCAPLGAAVLDEEEAVATAELFETLGVSQPTVSHHLKKLVDAGLLEREQRGRWAYFSLQRDAVETLAAVADLKGACC